MRTMSATLQRIPVGLWESTAGNLSEVSSRCLRVPSGHSSRLPRKRTSSQPVISAKSASRK